ncbi:G-type lectin S-receptor-like serine/threonine-protein kinase SD1-13 isoform X2 [Neltuma alba]|uniref:G-type lectin S-receptor-like serine/threonine-protein kinase SD1-13 isoform X2 n=1 Tax=Neltuma alba TaxID=207710 RepID=UPI0010A4E87D|nr:G-type lectin S-receptor-like serine/threonine-protein kinase SD1-13 isoform X2 [Prosopis alba]
MGLLPIFLMLLSFCGGLITALDSITSSVFVKDSETVSSNNSAFKLGFFSPQNTTDRYVGIWHVFNSKVTWVANKNQPLQDSSGVITISEDKNLVLLNGTKRIFWSSNVSNKASSSTAQLLNSGNLVLIDQTGKTLWESFQHPGDAEYSNLAISAHQKIGSSRKNPSERKLAYTRRTNKVGEQKVQENCDTYNYCGTYGICDSSKSPTCNCLKGFEPRNIDEWNNQNWTSGCVRRASLQCASDGGKDDWFLELQMTNNPKNSTPSFVSEDTCRNQCLKNCNCTAYAYVSSFSCMYWTGNLTGIVRLSSGGINLYVRQAYSEHGRKKKDFKVVITVTVTVGVIIIAISAYILKMCTAKYSARKKERNAKLLLKKEENPLGDLKIAKLEKLPLFDFRILATATNNFRIANKLGRGGFGLVYKEIAVKRLSRTSKQGLEEFMNEVVVISKLQHRNLVRLLGCCIEGEEKMLVYEYMPNKSLDAFIYDPVKKKALDWKNRLNIIKGIARGLLYLHRDSRLKIIHRDLKPSNILLDAQLNPKISDFGLARIFECSEDEGNTRRVVGTYGYMSPEYAMEGLFSEKSDVFSFGVLLFEIISGRKNTSICDHEHSLNLLELAWKLWNEENIESLIDSEISDPDYVNDIVRCIHIGFLCVQEHARDRPSMGTVNSMLNNHIVNLPPSCQPAYIQRRVVTNAESSQQSNRSCSVNSVTLTNMQGR